MKNNVTFAIRLKEGMTLTIDGKARSFASLLRRQKHGTWIGRLEGMKAELHFAARRLRGGEALIVATNTEDATRAFRKYRERWGIECLFGDCKTRGLNLEDTHITDPEKLDTLMSLVALAITWAYRCATCLKGRSVIPRKTHGRREKSWFRTGLDTLRKWLLYQPDRAVRAWIETYPKSRLQ